MTEQVNKVNTWYELNCNEILKLNHNLDENSIIFDIGGYKGLASEMIYNKFNCYIYIFEPIYEFYEILQNKFKDIKKIKVFNFGLSNDNYTIIMSKSEDASSANLKGNNSEEVKMINIIDFINTYQIKKIDLMEINIEGDEYQLLDYLLETKYINMINNIQIQFHGLTENYENKKNAIIEKLKITHFQTYCFDWLWENWKLKENTTNEDYIKIIIDNIELSKKLLFEHYKLNKDK
jgi:FkbM family methyltransferase